MATHANTLGRARTSFADPAEIDRFVETLERFERGEIDAQSWRAYRLVAGTYGQRQEGDLSMLRAKIPQGILSAEQLEGLARVAEDYSRGFLHLTTRQNAQFHFMKLHDVEPAMRRLAEVGITTREACGNSVRNITTSPTAGVANDELFDPTPYAEAMTRYFLRHPLSSSLPRKFKIAFSGAGTDHAFAPVNDLGWQARVATKGGRIVRGFRLTVGGGTALWCQSGRELFEFLPAGDILGVTEAILRVFDAHGDRVHRHKNRLRYLIKTMGWEVWRELFYEELSRARDAGLPALDFDPDAPPDVLAPATPSRSVDFHVLASCLGSGAHEGRSVRRTLPLAPGQNEARFFRTNVTPQRQAGYSVVMVCVPLGDLTSGQLRALAYLARTLGEGGVRTTNAQNLVFRWIRDADIRALYDALERTGLAASDPDSLADVTSCPGAESCKLAVTQSRGLARELNETFRSDLREVDAAHGLAVKISGCPNGCALHHIAGLGFQGGLRKVGGRAVPYYHVFAGGDPTGEAASFGRVIGKVPARRVVAATRSLIDLYRRERKDSESITHYFTRAPVEELRKAILHLEPLELHDATPEDWIDLGETEAFRPETTEGECAA
jgi:sulfite reductase beta subunit-like hemoprotein